jgi:transposase
MSMRFYTQQHRFYCGVDLHARTLSLHLLDQAGHTLLATTLDADGATFLEAIQPYRDDLVVCCECLFCWYWLADLCKEEEIAFVLGHALYMKAIHGGKAKNDKIDAAKIARLLRGGTIPYAYVYPKGMRETRDLLRRRLYLVRKRAETITHIQNTNSQYNLPPFGKKLTFAANRAELKIAERFRDPQLRKNVETDLHLLDDYDELLGDLELHLTRTAKVEDPQAYARVQSIPGVGKILALVLLYEIHQIQRFESAGQFLSYCRLVRCAHESAGKPLGFGGTKIGNAHLRWAFAEAAVLFARHSARAKQWLARQEKKLGKSRALSRLAARLGRTVYHLLRKREVFDENRFWGHRERVAPAAR